MDYIEHLRRLMESKSYAKGYIDLCVKYAKKLCGNKVPVIFDIPHLKDALKMEGVQMDAYSEFWVKGKSKMRKINSPSKKIKERQKWILTNILEQIEVSQFAHGFVKNKSILTNAKMHINSKYMLNIDIKDFFPTIPYHKVVNIFLEIGYTLEVSEYLAEICSFEKKIPQGGVTSPYISNIIFKRIDDKISIECKEKKLIYSRYADDITISGEFISSDFVQTIENIIKSEGFQLNKKKTRLIKDNQPKIVTGLIVSDKVTVGKKFKRKLRQEIFYIKKFGVNRHLENVCQNNQIGFKNYILGKVYFLKMVEPELGEEYLGALKNAIW